MKKFLLLMLLMVVVDSEARAEEVVVMWGGSSTAGKARRASWVDARAGKEKQEKMMELVRKASKSARGSELANFNSLTPDSIKMLQAFIRRHNISKVTRTEVSAFWSRFVGTLTCTECCYQKNTKPLPGSGSHPSRKKKIKSSVGSGMEYFALGIFPGWAWMAGKFRIWGFVVYPTLFDIHDESGKPLVFNFKGYTVPESLFIGFNYWLSVAYLMVLNGKIVHKALLAPCCSPRDGMSCFARKKFPVLKRTNKFGHTVGNTLNGIGTFAIVSPELVLYGKTLKTPADKLRHFISMPFYAAAEGGEIFHQQKISIDKAINRLYDKQKGQVVDHRVLLGHFLRGACNAVKFGYGDGTLMTDKFKDMLYDSLFLFKGSARSRISGPIDHREWRGAIAVLQKLFFIGQARDIKHEIRRILNSVGDDPIEKGAKELEAIVFPDTAHGRWQQSRKEFLQQALEVLKYNENLHWAHQILDVHASFKGSHSHIPERNREIHKLDFLRNPSLEAPDDMTEEDTVAVYFTSVAEEFRKATAVLTRLRENLDKRKEAKQLAALVHTPEEERWRNFVSAHPEETTEHAMDRAKWTSTLGAVLGSAAAKVMVTGFIKDGMKSFGFDPETANSVSEPIGWISSIGGAYGGARLFNAVTKPMDILESGVRRTVRGVSKLLNIGGLPAGYFSYKLSTATGVRAISNFIGGDDSAGDPYGLYTLTGVHPTPVYDGSTGNMTMLIDPDPDTLYTRGQVAGSVVPATIMAGLTARLGWRMLTEQTLHLHDIWTNYKYYRDTNAFNPHTHSGLRGELGWVAFNAFAGTWWAFTYLGVFKPGLEAAGASPDQVWASSALALLARGSYEGKIVERHWMDLAAFFVKKFSGADHQENVRSSIRDAKLLILMTEMIHYIEVEAPDSLVNNIMKWLKPS